MKKFTSPLSFFLSLFLLAGLVSPAALADGQEIPFSVEAAAAIRYWGGPLRAGPR